MSAGWFGVEAIDVLVGVIVVLSLGVLVPISSCNRFVGIFFYQVVVSWRDVVCYKALDCNFFSSFAG